MNFERTFDCAECAGAQVFSTVECAEGHGADCCEYACTACGAAVFLDPPALGERAPAPLRRAA